MWLHQLIGGSTGPECTLQHFKQQHFLIYAKMNYSSYGISATI